MGKVVLDDALRDRLSASESYVELCGTNGQTVGYFLKPDDHLRLQLAWMTSEVTDEEIARARQQYRERGGRTLPEVFAELRRRGIPGVPAE